MKKWAGPGKKRKEKERKKEIIKSLGFDPLTQA
jgi:hypothetical protein